MQCQVNDVMYFILNALVDEEVIVRPPQVVKYPKPTLWRLLKALYGLRKAPALWHKCLAELLAKLSVIQLKSDSSLYVGKDLVVFVHVDDLLAVGPGPQVERLFEEIQKLAEFRAEGWR